jgi:predicted glycosyltransferase
MKIWFDLSNSPHINMFGGMIRELEKEHEIIITCRPLANTIDLLDLHGFRYTVIGRHYGAEMSSKVLGFGVRVRQLQQFLAPKKIDVAISQSSFHSPVVAKLLGVRCIYLNDNEHAMGNIPAFMCASQIMVPEFLSLARLRKQYARERKVTHFPGIKEGIYLWQNAQALLDKKRSRPVPKRPAIYLRPEPWSAQYYRGALNFLDDLAIGLSTSAELTVLPRGQAQFAHYNQAKFAGVRVISSALDIADIVPDCDLFIGAGGTMTREMAVLGVPTISVYQDSLLAVDQYLLARRALAHRPALRADEALCHLDGCAREPSNDLLEKGRHAYAMIRKAILV